MFGMLLRTHALKRRCRAALSSRSCEGVGFGRRPFSPLRDASRGECCRELSGKKRSSRAANVHNAGSVAMNSAAYTVSELIVLFSHYLFPPCRN